MPFISQSSIQELVDRLDAVRIVSDYVHLEKRGGRFWACCPFHQEKTGSFTVNPDLKTYYCFGCHKGGTMINFVMEMDKINFPEAVEVLAKKFAVELVYENSSGSSGEDELKKTKKEELFELYRRMAGTFHHFLLKKEEAEAVKQYIISRGINIEMIEQFSLGYSPFDRYWLHKFLLQKGYSKEFLASSGLFSSHHEQIALFSGRLMFPIADWQGRNVAFGGRSLPAPDKTEERSVPKYINSPELGIYRKRETLYAINLALNEIRKTKIAYIAEGYMDVIALHQAGITNAIAPLGTAFTDEQAKLLKRWAEKLIFFFDTDEAGQTASLKAIYTCLKNNISCAIVDTSTDNGNSKDPADILLRNGPEVLQKKAKRFITDFDYLLFRAKAFHDKAQAVEFLFPYLDLLASGVARDSCIELASDAFGLLPEIIAEDYRKHAETKEEIFRKKEEIASSSITLSGELSLLLAVAVNYAALEGKNLFPKFRTALEISEIEDQNAKELFIALEECIRYGEKSMDELLARISSPELGKLLIKCSATGEFFINPELFVADGIKNIKEKRLKRKQEEIIVKLRLLKKNNDPEKNMEEKDLLAEKKRIDDEMIILRQGKQA